MQNEVFFENIPKAFYSDMNLTQYWVYCQFAKNTVFQDIITALKSWSVCLLRVRKTFIPVVFVRVAQKNVR